MRASPAIYELAERLIAYEAALDRTLQLDFSETCHVCEKLRRSLSRLVGPEGYYRSLLARALMLAQRETPLLGPVKVKEDGSIEGLTGKATEANVVLSGTLLI